MEVCCDLDPEYHSDCSLEPEECYEDEWTCDDG